MFRTIGFNISVLIGLTANLWAATGSAFVVGTAEGSDIAGTLKFNDTDRGLRITGTIQNVPTGEHGFHIHEYGDCADEGKAAGGHFNPDQKPHGMVTKDGATKVHPGDMGNLIANKKGMASVNILIPGVSLNSGRLNVAGRAIIVHDKKDDFGQPTGNAGDRIACGPIVLTAK